MKSLTLLMLIIQSPLFPVRINKWPVNEHLTWSHLIGFSQISPLISNVLDFSSPRDPPTNPTVRTRRKKNLQIQSIFHTTGRITFSLHTKFPKQWFCKKKKRSKNYKIFNWRARIDNTRAQCNSLRSWNREKKSQTLFASPTNRISKRVSTTWVWACIKNENLLANCS